MLVNVSLIFFVVIGLPILSKMYLITLSKINLSVPRDPTLSHQANSNRNPAGSL